MQQKTMPQEVFLKNRSISNDSYLKSVVDRCYTDNTDILILTLNQIQAKLADLQKEVAAIKKYATPENKVIRKNRNRRKKEGCRSTSFQRGLPLTCKTKKIKYRTNTENCCKRDHGRSNVSCQVRKKTERDRSKEQRDGSKQLLLAYLHAFLENFGETNYKRSECFTQGLGKIQNGLNNSLYLLKPTFTKNVVLPVFNGRDQSLDSYLTSIAEVSSSSASNQQNTMCIEWMRLESFRNYPLHTNVRPIRLAQAGFFYTQNTDEVQCFSCGKKYSGWQNNDDPIQIHIRISPLCRHVNGGDNDNVPIRYTEDIVATVSPFATQTDRQMMNTPQVNQCHDNSVNVSGSHENKSTTVTNQTASLSTNQEINVNNDRANENNPNSCISTTPGSSHVPGRNTSSDSKSDQSANTQCNTATNMSASSQMMPNMSASTSSSATINTLNGDGQSQTTRREQEPITNGDITKQERSEKAKERLHPLGISFNKPRYPNYAILSTRISTFQSWPSGLTQSPRDMGLAGFFYAGYSDYARCFFCGGGLRNWEPGDDPWVEHARWFPKCSFLNQNKGDDFVALVQQQQAELELTAAASANTEQKGASNEISSIPDNKGSISGNIFSSPAVLSVLEMGYGHCVVKKAIDEVKKRKSTDTISAADLMDVILEVEDKVTMSHRSKATDMVSGRRGNDVTTKEENNISELDDAEALETQSLMEENRRLKEQKLCKICLDQDACIAMLPCGHLCCCSSCAPAMRKCPICREFVKGTVRTWLA